MKVKNERGITIADFVMGMVIFIVGAAAILQLYLQIYKFTARVKINDTILGYVTEICEQIDLVNYDDITVENVQKMITNAKIPSNFTVNCLGVEKYSDDFKDANEKEIPDIVEKVYLNVSYKFDNKDRNYEITKLKVKE